MAVLQELINYMIAFGGLIAILFFGVNFLTQGFLLQYLRVKGSQGRKVLMRIVGITGTYYRPAKTTEGRLLWKDKSKDEKSLPFSDVEFSRFVRYEMGVSVITIDEVGNKLVDSDFKVVKLMNVDPGRNEALILKIKNRPVILDKRTTFILLGIGLLILIGLFCGFNLMQVKELLIGMNQNLTVNIR